MKVLVTGGAGFIGSHIVENLLKNDYEVVVYDNFSSGSMDNLVNVKKDIEVITGDILDKDSLFSAIKGCNYISHHAAQLEIFLSKSNPEIDLEVNTIGTLNVLNGAKKYEINKVINVSSACVYGQTNEATKETSQLNPNWPYGVSKVAAEKYANIYNDYENVPVINLRYGIVYGEREWYRRVLPIFIKRAILGKELIVFGKGDQIRDFVYVEDVVRFNLLCLQNDTVNGESFNVGTNTPTSIVDLAKTVSLLKNIPIDYEEIVPGEYSKIIPEKRRNSAELKTMLLDISKAERLLNWEPKFTLEEGLIREINWATENLHRWEKIRYTEVL